MIMKQYLKRADENKRVNEAKGKVDKKSIMGMLDKEEKKLKSMFGRLRSIKGKAKSEDIEIAIDSIIDEFTDLWDEFGGNMDMFIDEIE